MNHTSQSESGIAMTGIFNDSYPPIMDGVTLTVQNYAQALQANNWNPCVVTPWNPLRLAAPYPVMRYFSLPIRNRHPYRYGYPKLDPFIWHKLRTTQFRLVHSHSPFSAGRLGVYVARHQRVPLIGTFHSKYRSDLQHSFRKTPWMVPIIMKRILAFYNACDHVWIPQASVESTVREYGYEGKLTVVENGNDLASRYEPEQLPNIKRKARITLNVPHDAISLLFVGQHIREKGIDIISQALSLLPSQVKFVMHFIGNGYAINDLRRYVRDHALQDKVTIHGVINDRNTLACHYAAADLFLFPSFYDNAPLVIREAAAMYTPSILLEGSTASEVIRDGENGFLTHRSPQAYADTITRLYLNPQLMDHAARGARSTLTRTWEDVTNEVMSRYVDILERYSYENS